MSITRPEPKRITQDAFLANAYMVGAAFIPGVPHRLWGVPEVQTGEGGEYSSVS